MAEKRVTILSGHYGSGKTNIALTLAKALRKKHPKTAIADIDIVNPYFRTKDSAGELEREGIRLICSPYANTNLDIPALPQDLYAVTDDKSLYCILDVGGDERGALALGRIAPALREENSYDMLCVVNRFRPLTPDAESTYEVMQEIEQASGLRFTGIINNSNLGNETTKEVIESSLSYGDAVAAKAGIPLVYTAVPRFLEGDFRDKDGNFLVIDLQKKI